MSPPPALSYLPDFQLVFRLHILFLPSLPVYTTHPSFLRYFARYLASLYLVCLRSFGLYFINSIGSGFCFLFLRVTYPISPVSSHFILIRLSCDIYFSIPHSPFTFQKSAILTVSRRWQSGQLQWAVNPSPKGSAGSNPARRTL